MAHLRTILSGPFWLVATLWLAVPTLAFAQDELYTDSLVDDEAAALPAPLEPLPPVPKSLTPYELDRVSHGVFTGATYLTLGIFSAFVQPNLPAGSLCGTPENPRPCKASKLLWPDSTVVGNKSRAWQITSDITAGMLIGGAALMSGLDSWKSDSEVPVRDFLTDVLVIAEAGAVAELSIYFMKVAVNRGRPTQFVDDPDYVDGLPYEHRLSFPSGHSGFSAAMAMSYAMTFTYRHPDSRMRYPLYAALGSLVAITGYARIGGGRHFYSDVLAGYVIGAASGFLIPRWHRKKDDLGLYLNASFTPDGGSMVALGGQF